MLAIALALLPFPALRLLDHLNRGCGDGLCGFYPGLIVLGGLAAATGALLIRSARRGEGPAALRLVPLALWAMLVPLLML
jgi:hypothetical protein